MQQLPTAEEVAATSRELGLAATAAELHGGLCGWLAGGGGDVPDWPARVLADPALPAPARGSALDLLRQATAERLEDGEFAFQLVLDDDDAPLRQRAQALFDWCRGFLGGFGLAAGANRHCRKRGPRRCRTWASWPVPGSRTSTRTTMMKRPCRSWKSSCGWPPCCCTAIACLARATGSA